MTRPLRLVHVGIHDSLNGNAGDTLLFQAVRDLVEQTVGPVEWTLRQLWEPFEAEDAAVASETHDGIIVGGGGLLLRDQQGSDTSRSGWQWNASVDAVRALDVPLIVFAIGYNRFRGQAEFDAPFGEHLTAVADKAGFLGLRNSGSIRSVRSYLPPHLRRRPRLLPCPTTVAAQLYSLPTRQRRAMSPVLGVNLAFDRLELRLGREVESVLTQVASAVTTAQHGGWQVRLFLHKQMDGAAIEWLDRAGTRYEVCDLSAAAPGRVLAAYSDVDLALGMRGHSQMIPFGLQRPIVSLVSHDKLAWFLEDLERPDWGVDVRTPRLHDRIVAAIDAGHSLERWQDTARLQERLWDSTSESLAEIAELLRPSGQHALGKGAA